MGIPEKRLHSKSRGGFAVSFLSEDGVYLTDGTLLHITGGCDTEPVALLLVLSGPDKGFLRSVPISRLVVE